MKIYLSASNQTDNKYNTQAQMSECDVCYLIAQKTQDYLSSINGIECKLGGKLDTMASKVKASNDFEAEYHICIHTNAGGGKGTEVYIAPKNINDTIVNKVYQNVANLTPNPDRGIKNGLNLYEVKYTNAKCIYIEVEFHDSYGDWIFENVDEIAYAIASSFGQVKETNVVNSNNLFKVQVGAFTTLERAERYKKELKSKYNIDTYIVKP